MNPASSDPAHDAVARLRHDLRTPLNQIIGYSELIQEEAADAGQSNALPDLEKILAASRRLLGMINAAIEPGHIQLLKELPDFKNLDDPSSGNPTVSSKKNREGTHPEVPVEDDKPAAPRKLDVPARVLVVDDDPENCEVLARRLAQEGYDVVQAHAGEAALDLLRGETPIDVVLLDVLMPGMDGFEVLVKIKGDEKLRHLPVIMISALDQLESVVRCIQNGADDYLGKPFNPTLLRARLGASLDRKRLRDQEQRTYLELKKTQEQLVGELAEAEAYVRSQLPRPLAGGGPVSTQWKFVTSSRLGGDAFGYHWIDNDHFSLYLLDVCGHGVGAALLSISALKTISGEALAGVDFRDPAQVLTALNEAFPMERHNNMYFTLWYGVYCPSKGQLRYASAGHPPSLLLAAGNGVAPVSLRTPNLFIGGWPGVKFVNAVQTISPGSRFYVFSDGVYEIRRPDRSMMSLEDLADFIAAQPMESTTVLEDIWTKVRAEHAREGALDDDFSIVEFRFA